MDEKLKIGKLEFDSRLMVGTGKYASDEVCRKALEESGAEIVTLRILHPDELKGNDTGGLEFLGELTTDYLSDRRIALLPNTAGCYAADDAIKIALHSQKTLETNFIKLEVIGDKETLFPDIPELLKASDYLVKKGFSVLPYTNDDPVTAEKLERIGCVAIMPLAAPIGSGLGIRNPYNIKIILGKSKVPVIIDAGVGAASDAAIAMELGCDGILMNTAIARSKDPVNMAKAMKLAVQAGRLSYLSGRIPKRLYASASTSIVDLVQT